MRAAQKTRGHFNFTLYETPQLLSNNSFFCDKKLKSRHIIVVLNFCGHEELVKK